jgi:glycosyltransferase involved in cell wall biosynthesis
VIEETKKPLVSVIMPCYKMGQFIGEALESIGKQTYTNWEVIAVDDFGPEDGTKEAVEVFAKQFPNQRVIYHRHETNGGVSAARNTAIGLARGEYLAFLDPDDWWEIRYLEMQMLAFKGNDGLAVVYTGTSKVDASGRFLEEWTPPQSYDLSLPKGVFLGNYINPSAAVATKESVVKVGCFDTTPELQHVEDWDLWIKLALSGYIFKRSSAPLVNYRQHEGAAGSDLEKLRQRTLALMYQHASNPVFFKVFLDRLHFLEKELMSSYQSYRNLLDAHKKTFDRRIKSFLKQLIKK